MADPLEEESERSDAERAPAPVPGGGLARWLRAGLATAVVDGLFSSVLVAGFYGSTVARLWQGVASTLLGPSALEGGARTVAIGLLMHLTTAFWWSGVFVFGLLRLGWIRRTLGSPRSLAGVMKVAALYGPCIWLAMSIVVIPVLAHRPPSLTFRWWVQLFGHVPFVALPMIVAASWRQRAGER